MLNARLSLPIACALLCSTAKTQQWFAPWFMQPGNVWAYQPPNPPPLFWGENRVFASAGAGSVPGTTTFIAYVAQTKPSGTCSDTFWQHNEYVAYAIWDLGVLNPPFATLPGAHPSWSQIHIAPTVVASPTSSPTGSAGQIGYIQGCTTSEDPAFYVSQWSANTIGLSGTIVGMQWLTLDLQGVWKLSASLFHTIQ